MRTNARGSVLKTFGSRHRVMSTRSDSEYPSKSKLLRSLVFDQPFLRLKTATTWASTRRLYPQLLKCQSYIPSIEIALQVGQLSLSLCPSMAIFSVYFPLSTEVSATVFKMS